MIDGTAPAPAASGGLDGSPPTDRRWNRIAPRPKTASATIDPPQNAHVFRIVINPNLQTGITSLSDLTTFNQYWKPGGLRV
jgi:hypothetical protein